MSYKVKTTHKFLKQLKKLAKKYPSIKSDLLILEKELLDDPRIGDPIFSNCYKIRLAIKSKGRGKSGGARVITYVYVENESIYLLDIYDKSEQTTISLTQLKWLLKDLN